MAYDPGVLAEGALVSVAGSFCVSASGGAPVIAPMQVKS